MASIRRKLDGKNSWIEIVKIPTTPFHTVHVHDVQVRSYAYDMMQITYDGAKPI